MAAYPDPLPPFELGGSFNEQQAMADYETATPGLIEARDAIDRDYPTRYCRDCRYAKIPTDYTKGPQFDEAICLHPALGDAVSGKPLPCRHNRYYSSCGIVGHYFEPKE